MKCKYCGTESHYCGSCEFDLYMEIGYCDDDCVSAQLNQWDTNNEETKLLNFLIYLIRCDYVCSAAVSYIRKYRTTLGPMVITYILGDYEDDSVNEFG